VRHLEAGAADVIGDAVKVMRMARGEETEALFAPRKNLDIASRIA
jgi:hypothetical protein